MTDARILRTRSALHSAILELASQRPVSEITVSELADSAKINRVTFYKHYNTAAEALADALTEALAAQSAQIELAGTNYERFVQTVDGILDYIEQHLDLHRIGFAQTADGTVPLSIAMHIADAASVYLAKRRKQKPSLPDFDPDVAASYLASGTTGALSVWVAEGDMSRERFYENLERLLPPWVFTESDA